MKRSNAARQCVPSDGFFNTSSLVIRHRREYGVDAARSSPVLMNFDGLARTGIDPGREVGPIAERC
jgi:hypothetical protein